VPGAKTITLKQYLNTVGSRFNRVIELNQKMLILKRFVTKNDFLCDDDN
jgi:hypothetical protein